MPAVTPHSHTSHRGCSQRRLLPRRGAAIGRLDAGCDIGSCCQRGKRQTRDENPNAALSASQAQRGGLAGQTAGLLQLTGTRSSRTSPYGSRRGRSAGTEPGRKTTETLTATWNWKSTACHGACHGPSPARPPARSPRRSPAAGPEPRCLRRAARRGTSPSFSTTAAAPAAQRWRRRTARRGGPGSALRGHPGKAPDLALPRPGRGEPGPRRGAAGTCFISRCRRRRRRHLLFPSH